jgi:hypothetical protein
MGKIAKAVGNIRLPFFVLPLVIGVAAGVEMVKYAYKIFKN